MWTPLPDAPEKNFCILFSKEAAFQVTNTLEDPDGRFLLLNAKTEDRTITFCNVCAPSGYPKYKEMSTFFNNLKTVISDFKPNDSQLILGGDFNCVLDDDLDRSRPFSKHDPSVKSLKTLINNFIWMISGETNIQKTKNTLFIQTLERAVD